MNTAGRGFILTEEGVKRVRNEINRQNLSIEQLAEITSCSQATLRRLIRGERVSEKLLNKVLSALNFDSENRPELAEEYSKFGSFSDMTDQLSNQDLSMLSNQRRPTTESVYAAFRLWRLHNLRKKLVMTSLILATLWISLSMVTVSLVKTSLANTLTEFVLVFLSAFTAGVVVTYAIEPILDK